MAKAPRVPSPPEATRSCELYTLPTDRVPERADLEIGYATRGLQILECDGRRQLAVSANTEQQDVLTAWEQARADRRCPWWKVWGCKAPE